MALDLEGGRVGIGEAAGAVRVEGLEARFGGAVDAAGRWGGCGDFGGMVSFGKVQERATVGDRLCRTCRQLRIRILP